MPALAPRISRLCVKFSTATCFLYLSKEFVSVSFHCTYASFVFILLRTLLRPSESYLSCFQTLPHSFNKTPGGGIPLFVACGFLP